MNTVADKKACGDTFVNIRSFCSIRKYDYTEAELSRMSMELAAKLSEVDYSTYIADDPVLGKVRMFLISELEEYFA